MKSIYFLFLGLVFSTLALAAELPKNDSRCAEVLVKSRASGWLAPKVWGGYTLIAGTMVGTAAATSYLTTILPGEAKFLTQLISQLSTLGIYIMGTPIWEPLASYFRARAFRMSSENLNPAMIHSLEGYEQIWQNGQRVYSINAQMARNIINQFIIATQQNFALAHHAMHRGDRDYAGSQIAEAAVRMRRLFAEVPPNEPSVALAVRATFSQHINIDQNFRNFVWLQIVGFDKEGVLQESVQNYYQQLISAWLGENGAS